MYSTSRYKEISAETASPERLLVMLFDAALKNIRNGIAALEGNGPEATAALTRASDIVVELHSTLDRSKAPELCDQLAEIYRFVSLRLIKSVTARDPVSAREAERALVPIAEAFKEAVAQVAAGANP